MALNFLFLIFIVFIIIRTTAYGIYCIRNTGIAGGISVFLLDAAVISAGYMILFTGKGV